MYLAKSSVDWGSVPDWIAGIGSVLAFIGFAVAFWWEIHRRRVDDRQRAGELRDQEMAQARLVFTKHVGGSPNQIRLVVKNRSQGQVFVESADLMRPDDRGARRAAELIRRDPMVSDVSPGEDGDVWLWLSDEEPRLEIGQEYWLRLTFTDVDGRRWSRDEDEQPVRLIHGLGER
jgi:hypothetical protein